jgi:hypothetical protein
MSNFGRASSENPVEKSSHSAPSPLQCAGSQRDPAETILDARARWAKRAKDADGAAAVPLICGSENQLRHKQRKKEMHVELPGRH